MATLDYIINLENKIKLLEQQLEEFKNSFDDKIKNLSGEKLDIEKALYNIELNKKEEEINKLYFELINRSNN